ncbi:hypothetical protein UY3_09087 [Chelonia mydas]|uniref:Uncharacterized protein n=1 Tax=Chelonia mydas TaxID=8469 RepID=M7B9G3_CHEMY|nr:hypothetical protein UY3_09087 [Chelonia mydas]
MPAVGSLRAAPLQSPLILGSICAALIAGLGSWDWFALVTYIAIASSLRGVRNQPLVRCSYANLIPDVDSARSTEEFFYQPSFFSGRWSVAVSTLKHYNDQLLCCCGRLGVDIPLDSDPANLHLKLLHVSYGTQLSYLPEESRTYELPWSLRILNFSGNRCTSQNGYR